MIRAGFGVYYDIVPTVVTTAGTPFVVNEPSQTNSNTNPVVVPQVFPTTVAALTTVSLPGAYKKNLRIPYSLQYNFTVERQIGRTGIRVSYVGAGTRQGEIQTNINQPVASTVPYTQKPRRFPNYPAITYTTNGGGHQYNGFTTEVKRRFAHGLLYDFSWTWARDIGDLERDQSPEDAYNINRERAAWEDIPTHRVTGDIIYELPLGRGRKWLSRGRAADLVFGGWQVMAAATSNTGFFLAPLWSGPDPTNTRYTTGSVPTVSLRPNALHDPNLPSDKRSVTNWFDLTAFGPPSPGQFGTSSKGVIVGPGAFTVDTGIAKAFLFTERFHMRLELTSTPPARTHSGSASAWSGSSQNTSGLPCLLQERPPREKGIRTRWSLSSRSLRSSSGRSASRA